MSEEPTTERAFLSFSHPDSEPDQDELDRLALALEQVDGVSVRPRGQDSDGYETMYDIDFDLEV